MVVDDPCTECHGSGRAMSSRTVQARIPAGVADGQRIRIPGRGAPGENGGKAGDLYVRVSVKPHPVFGRSGSELTVTVPVTITELALGADIKVPTHRGPAVTIHIPPGTPNGRVFRVPGRGVRRKDGQAGALLVTVEVSRPAGTEQEGTLRAGGPAGGHGRRRPAGGTAPAGRSGMRRGPEGLVSAPQEVKERR